ncbi:MAG: hypothetical protein WDZ75_00075 [Candidatus Paceibacterota bacterium]
MFSSDKAKEKEPSVLQHLSGTILTAFIFLSLLFTAESPSYSWGIYAYLVVGIEILHFFASYMLYKGRGMISIQNIRTMERVQPYLVASVGCMYLAYTLFGAYIHLAFGGFFIAAQVGMRVLEGVRYNNVYTVFISFIAFVFVFYSFSKYEAGAFIWGPDEIFLAGFIYFTLYGLLQVLFLSFHSKSRKIRA